MLAFDLSDPQDFEAALSYPHTIPACPTWCTLPDGHEYDEYAAADPVQHYRVHRVLATPADGAAALEVRQLETNRAGAVTLPDDPMLYVRVGGEEMVAGSVTEARMLAAAFTVGAELLDRVDAGGGAA